MNERFAEHRRRRAELASDPDVVDAVLAAGIERADALAERTLDDVRDCMGMRYVARA